MLTITPLSEREKEILTLVASGLTNREIAQNLSISPNTVKVHLSNIFEKIGVASRTEATVYAIEHRIVDVPGGETGQEGTQSPYGFFGQRRWIWVASILLFVALLVVIIILRSNRDNSREIDLLLAEGERWQELTPMPELRTGMAAVAYDENLYIIAGEGPEGVSGKVFLYSLEENKWTTVSPKPIPVTDMAGAVIGEKIYVPGGLTKEGSPINNLEIYDPRRDKWDTGSPLPKKLSAYALTTFEGKLYLFGGSDGTQILNVVYIYDPASDSWHEGAAMPISSRNLGAVAVENRIIVLGGQNREGVLDQSWAYFPSRDVDDGNPWESFISMPVGCSGFGVANVYDTIYVLGGIVADLDETSRRAWMMTGEEWVDLPVDQGYGGRQVAVVPLGSQLFILDSDESQEKTKTWLYQAFIYSIYIPYLP